MITRAIAITLSMITMFACSEIERVDTASVKVEMDNRDARKISEAQLLERAQQLGNDFADQLQAQKLNLIEIPEENARFGYTQKTNKNVKVKWISLEEANYVGQIEESLFDIYKYDDEHGNKSVDNVQMCPDRTEVIFTRGGKGGFWSLRIPVKVIALTFDADDSALKEK